MNRDETRRSWKPAVWGILLLAAQASAADESPGMGRSGSPVDGQTVRIGRGGSFSRPVKSDGKITILSPDGKRIVAEEIDSRNRKSFASVDFEKEKTTVYRVNLHGNVGRREPFWAMDGRFDLLGLSNDGEYLAVGDWGSGLLPPGFRKDRVLVTFFRRGKKIDTVTLERLIGDLSTIQRTGSGYRWGRSKGMNAAGHLVVETGEGKVIPFDIRTGKPIEPGQIPREKIPGWKRYLDIMGWYELRYPEEYSFRGVFEHAGIPAGGRPIPEGQAGRGAIEISFHDMDVLPREPGDPGELSFEKFAAARALTMFGGDGPCESRYVSDVPETRVFTNSHGRKCVEMRLSIVRERCADDDSETITETRPAGPVYAVSVSPPDDSPRALILVLRDEEGIPAGGKEILEKIVDTVRIPP